MIGDKIHVEQYHLEIAKLIASQLIVEINQAKGRYCISVAGESGSGKSVSATALKVELEAKGVLCSIIQQDDYFFLPPKTNELKRRKSLTFVGPIEVNLQLIDEHLQMARDGVAQLLKPLVIFNENRAITETLDIENSKVILVEGTYISLLKNVDKRIFINRDCTSTIESIRNRGRDLVDNFLIDVLAIEHSIISKHMKLADIIINEGVNVEFVTR